MMNKNDDGYIVVETIGAFIPFTLLIVSILSLVNIITLQARVHYAMTQAAITISMYCYALEAIGIADSLSELDSKSLDATAGINSFKNNITDVLSGIDDLMGSGGSDASNRSFGSLELEVGDPKDVLQKLLNFGTDAAVDMLFEQLARPLVGRYLANGNMTGDEYLRSVGVTSKQSSFVNAEGLGALRFFRLNITSLSSSALIDKDGNVRLVVEYEVEYTFGGLPLPFRPTLRITQSAITKAWLNGSGEGYNYG